MRGMKATPIPRISHALHRCPIMVFCCRWARLNSASSSTFTSFAGASGWDDEAGGAATGARGTARRFGGAAEATAEVDSSRLLRRALGLLDDEAVAEDLRSLGSTSWIAATLFRADCPNSALEKASSAPMSESAPTGSASPSVDSHAKCSAAIGDPGVVRAVLIAMDVVIKIGMLTAMGMSMVTVGCVPCSLCNADCLSAS